MQVMTLNGEWENTMILSICFENMKISDHRVWAFERNVGSTSKLLLGSFTEKYSSKEPVYVIIHLILLWEVGSYLLTRNTHMKETHMSRVAMSLQRLGIENTLCTIGEVYGVVECQISKILSNFVDW